MPDEKFTGPLFLVGMPRSGTKLLRTLLNQHPAIFIPQVESDLLPYWHANWQAFGDLSDRKIFARFYQNAVKLPYFLYTAEERGVITLEAWYGRCKCFDLSGVFAALIQHDADLPEASCRIWGDKTPSYLAHMPLLKQLYPSARFIHLVRDVRDYCLSIEQAWGKNKVRAAHAWAERLAVARQSAQQFPGDYMVVRYEDLVTNPEPQLRAICRFLDLPFVTDMLTPTIVVENLGDAQGRTDILTDNTNKYLQRLQPVMRTRIESLAVDELRLLGYPVAYTGSTVRLSPLRLRFLQVLDGFNLIRFEMRQRGFLQALRLRVRLFITSGNRAWH